jgi:8-oxo-dGTP diphosphatase
MRIMVVRHGLAVSKKGWTGVDADRPLVRRGQRQARTLGPLLAARPPVRIISSPAVRCRQTVGPLASDMGVVVELSDQLSTDAPAAAVDLSRRLISSAGPNCAIVLCTHREVMVELLPELTRDFTGRLAHRPPGAKGGAWILKYRRRRLESIDYRPPKA